MSERRLSSGPPFHEPFQGLVENRWARAAIDRLLSDDELPLVYLVGPAGVGKSHLAREALMRWKVDHPKDAVIHLDAGRYAADLAEASEAGQIPAFQKRTRRANLFIIEDVQHLSGRTETQQQLLATMNDVSATGGRFLVTSSYAPGQLAAIDRRLISRFRGGLLATLSRPGLASRKSLLVHFARCRKLAIAADVADLVAAKLEGTPRELYAALVQLETLSRVERQPLDRRLAGRWLATREKGPELSPASIVRVVSRRFGVPVTRLRDRDRMQSVAMARQCAMGLIRELTTLPLGEIGKYFGGRDHSTVLHACQRFRELMATNAEFQQEVRQIRVVLGVPDEPGTR
jgi:chromosomal replication initiator protein